MDIINYPGWDLSYQNVHNAKSVWLLQYVAKTKFM